MGTVRADGAQSVQSPITFRSLVEGLVDCDVPVTIERDVYGEPPEDTFITLHLTEAEADRLAQVFKDRNRRIEGWQGSRSQ